MFLLPHALAVGIGAFATMFSQRVFEHAKLIGGAVLAPGKRTRSVEKLGAIMPPLDNSSSTAH